MSQLFTSIARSIPLAGEPFGVPRHLTPADLGTGIPGGGGPPQPRRPTVPSLRSIEAQLRQRVPAGQPGAGQFLPNTTPRPVPYQGPVTGPVLQFQLDQIAQMEELGQAAEAERLRRTTMTYLLQRGNEVPGGTRSASPGAGPPGAGPPVLRPPAPGPGPSVGEFLEHGIIKSAVTVEALKQTSEGVKGLAAPDPQPSNNDLINATRVTVGPTVFFGTLPYVGSAAAGLTVAIPFTLGYIVYALRKERESLQGLAPESELTSRDPINLDPQDLLTLRRKNALAQQLEEQVAKERASLILSPDHVTGPIQDC